MGAVVAFGGLNELTPSLLLKVIFSALGFGVVAVLLHLAAERVESGAVSISLRSLVLVVILLGVMSVVMSIPRVFVDRRRPGTARDLIILANSHGEAEKIQSPASRRESIVGLVLVVLSLFAAVIEMVNSLVGD